jgi:hypothetical protein
MGAMHPRHQEQLDRALSLSDAMLAQARDSDWAAVLGTEMERSGVLADLFAGGVHPSDALAVAAGIRRIQEINEQVMALGARLQQEIVDELAILENGRKAARAYSQE